MNREFLKTYGVLAATILLAIVAFVGMITSKKHAATNAESNVTTLQALEPQPTAPTPQEEIQGQIEQQRAEIEKDPKAEDAPAKLLAVCNLHMKVQDFNKAVEACLRFLADYPDSPRVGEAYIQLSSCYKQMNDQEKLNRLFLDMMKKFPKESPEYEYAKQQLGL